LLPHLNWMYLPLLSACPVGCCGIVSHNVQLIVGVIVMSKFLLALSRIAFATIMLGTSYATAAESQRDVIISKDSDYFGFDLRTEKDVDLGVCETICLSDKQCNAFTYNPKVQWCFLKTDFGKLQSAPGSIAGKVIEVAGGEDLGAPEPLSFAGNYIDAAAQYRTTILAAQGVDGSSVSELVAAAREAENAGDNRNAAFRFGQAIAANPDEAALWNSLARNTFAIVPSVDENYTLQQSALSAALNGYQTSRNIEERAEALSLFGKALDRNSDGRGSIDAYKASLELQASAETDAALLDARSRYGFRILGNTIDADAETPRACVQFSEDLTDADYTNFVRLDDATPQALTAQGREICVDGLKHGSRYRLTLRAGLPSVVGENLEKPVALNLFVRDRAANVRFNSDNFVLPGSARRGIPLVSVNANAATISLYRVGDRSLTQILDESQFLRQLDGYSVEKIKSQIGAPVWQGEVEIKNTPNAEVTTSIDVDKILPQRKPGVYVMTAGLAGKETDEYEAKSTQWFVVSDVGLTTFTGEDGMHVFARSLETAKPLANVALKLLARNNEVLAEAVTDDDGNAVFVAGLTRGQAGLAPAIISAANGEDDFVFLDLTRAGFDLSDRGVTGRPAAGDIDILAWTERGIYRAGETVHAQALARDIAANAVDNLPLVFVFIRPDGVEDRRVVSDGQTAGGHSVDLTLQTNAQRGAWNLKIYVDVEQEPLATQVFLVEDFVPDRAEFTLSGGSLVIGEPTEVSVDARYLYGAPAAGLGLEGETIIAPVQTWAKFPGYTFGLSDEEDNAGETRITLDDLPVLDEQGQAKFDVIVGDAPDTTRLLSGRVIVRMSENGGRAVERELALDIAPQADVIGIKPAFDGGQLAEGAQAKFGIIAANPAGEQIDLSGLEWTLVKVDQNYQWYRDGSSWRYETVEFTTKIGNGTLDAAAAQAVDIAANVDWGRYRLEVQEKSGAGAISSVEFDAGYYVAAASTETPDGLEIALDKATYKAGETAQLKFSPRFAGEALVTIGSEKLLSTFVASVPENGSTLDIPVSADWGAGAYVTAVLYRPGSAQESRMPMRAIGVKWLGIDPENRKLAVKLEVPEKTQPGKLWAVPVTVTGVEAGSEAYVTLAAVDVGILNLTNYQAPAPDDWYFGQRRLGLEMRDLYGRLIDGSAGETGKLRTGGDGPMASSKGTPPTEKLMALYSGIVKLDNEGRAVINLDVPQFNGTARLMAVAWSAAGVGHATQDVIIRDPVVILASAPRFMAEGDQSRMLIELANTDGPEGDYTLSVATGDTIKAGAFESIIALTKGQRTSVTIPLNAASIGTGEVKISLAHASGLQLETSRIIPVRAQNLPVTTKYDVPLAANGGKVLIDRELLASSILDGASVSVSVAASNAFDVPSLLMALDRYPYGCAEQTTSRALPLLYVAELAANAGLEPDPAIKERIDGAIARVLNYQSSTGSFGLWGPGSGDTWLDAYVTDFLTRAREQGFVVPDQAMIQALDNLQNTLAVENDATTRGSEIAYALYVLARNRRASMSDLRYYSESQLDLLASPMARAQIGASLALYGDQPAAERAFGSALQQAQTQNPVQQSRSDYGSSLRDGAAMLALAAETKPAISTLKDMITYVGGVKGQTRYSSTQDDAWMLLAARALADENKAINLTIDGAAHSGGFAKTVTGEELEAAPIAIINDGAEALMATVTSIAAPMQSLPASGDGFSIERKFYNLDGTETTVTSVQQNQRYVVVLTVSEDNAWPSRILVTDLLSSGFEIDNPRIVGSAELPNFPWLGAVEFAHTEYRDDRFVAAFNRTGGEARSFSFAYVVRAVTPGTYALPAASVEDMYRPEYSARTATGLMEVTAN
jgi:alpha-2-macroglobulin